MVMFADKAGFIRAFTRKMSSMFGKSLEEASNRDRYAALASIVRDEINERWVNTNKGYLNRSNRQVFYFSLEFLLGRFLESNLLYLGLRDVCEEGLKDLNLDLQTLIEVEPDAGLGNGGLGRLAACFLDSIASMALPGHGNGIRYRHGLFNQKIVDGYQVELPDNWLRETNIWEIRKPDKAVEVRFGGNVYAETLPDGSLRFHHENYQPVLAVPYDIPIVGYRNSSVNTLRLWSAECVDTAFDFANFSRGDYVNAMANSYSVEAISEVLYPDDSTYKNRILRLKQQYFFVSAGLQSIVRRFKKKNAHEVRELDRYVCVQINDTHPALAVPELMRILLDNEGLEWDEAWRLTTHIIAYTNHTIMPEALEKWPTDIFNSLLPRIAMIVEEINRRFCLELMSVYPNDSARVARMSIIWDGMVRMANLAVVGSFSVNGVAAVHSELLKTEVLRDFYEYYPQKFNNKTNGITQRRWLQKSNPALSAFITESIGEGWLREPLQLRHLKSFENDTQALIKLHDIKRKNKERLAEIILAHNDLTVDPDSIFDVQVKRIHAYKRQLLNLMHVLHLYYRLQDGEDIGVPRTFIMAGKAAPSYYYAKNIIKLAKDISALLARTPSCRGKLALVFLENYGVALAEYIFPASEISEQISTASKEASGTSNMKFMMNGAVTIGTGDGANIEIREQVGDDNYIDFGLSVAEVLEYYSKGSYSSQQYYNNDPRIKRVVNAIRSGISPTTPSAEFETVVRSLLDYNDEFFVLRDFDAYVTAQERVQRLYADARAFDRMSLVNIAGSGVFSSDNTISRYAKEIWHIDPLR
jgi:starch phosphorylase